MAVRRAVLTSLRSAAVRQGSFGSDPGSVRYYFGRAAAAAAAEGRDASQRQPQASWQQAAAAAVAAAAFAPACLGQTSEAKCWFWSKSTQTEEHAADEVQASPPPPSWRPKEVVLYQYDSCPFCNKVKAYLDYSKIPYKVVEVNPVGKKELAWSQYKKVPVLVVDGEQFNDSTAIITELEKRLTNDTREEREEEAKWRNWVDTHLVHLLSPNIYRTPSEAIEAFDYISTHGNFTGMQRFVAKYLGAASMYIISKRLKKRHHIEDERQSLYDAANEWVGALGDRQFMGGDKPNLADVSVFGVLRAILELQAGRELLENTKIGPWLQRMTEAVGESLRLD
eukprot:jgi/Chlat1/6873/Chrsp51S06537